MTDEYKSAPNDRGPNSPSAAELDFLERLADSLPDNQTLHDQLQQLEQHRLLLDVALGGSAERAFRERVDLFEQRRRYLNPLLDSEFVMRLTGGLDNDLMCRATMNFEPDALRVVREQVDSAAALRITDHWVGLDQARGHAYIPATEFEFGAKALVAEAHRMLTVYGPALAEQGQFLTEYRANLALFRTDGLAAFECADLLARIAMAPTFAVGFFGYDPSNVGRVQAYGKSALRELKADFDRDGNPIHAWEAFVIARRYGIDRLDWVEDYLARAADRILKILGDAAGGKPVGREAERVGQALGFGMAGPGTSGWFKHATILQRDRAIFLRVTSKVEAGAKLDFAYDEVKEEFQISRSATQRAYKRVTELHDEVDGQTKTEGKVS